jgi:ketosteroid isomerase-like protein
VKIVSLLIIMALWIAPIASASEAGHKAEQPIKDAVIAMWDAVERGDVDAYLEYIHPDYTLFGEGDLFRQDGKDLERASYTDYLGRVENVRTFMHQPEVVIRGDTAWITYYWSDSGYYTRGAKAGERFTSQGKSTRIFVKENDRWLCIHGHFTSTP